MQSSAKDSGQIRFQQRGRCLVDAISCFVCQMESQFKLTDIGVLACYFVTIKSRRKELVSQEVRLLPLNVVLSFCSTTVVWFAFE